MAIYNSFIITIFSTISPGSTDEANATEMEANTTFHDLEEHMDAKYGVIRRVKRFIFRKSINDRNNAEDTIRHGDDGSSESDDEGDQHDRIPLVRRKKEK